MKRPLSLVSTHAFCLLLAKFSSAKIRFLHLISEIVKIDYHLPEQMSIGVTNFCLNIFGPEGIRQRATKCVSENPA